MICEDCGKEDDTVEERIDPYQEEIHDRIVYVTICYDCYRNLKGDI